MDPHGGRSPCRGLRLGALAVVQGILLAGCVSYSPYGRPTAAELEPLAGGWLHNLAVRRPNDWDSMHDQYRWQTESGVLVLIGTYGFTEGTRIEVEFRNEGTSPVYLDVVEGESVYAVGPSCGPPEYRLAGGKAVRIDPGHRRILALHGIPWLGSPRVGDSFSVRFEIRSGERVEICHCAFAVNHLRDTE